MATYSQSLEQQRKDKRKARRSVLLFLLLLLLLLFFPFISGKLQTEQLYDQVIEVQFEPEVYEQFEETASSEKSSAKAASAEVESPVEETPEQAQPEEVQPEEPQVEPEPEPEVVERKPIPVPDPVPVTAAPSPTIMTSSEPDLKVNVAEMIKKLPSNAQVEEVSEEVTEVTQEIPESFMDDIADFFGSASGSGDKSTGKTSDAPIGKPSDGGEGDSGSSDSGDSDQDGKGDAGDGIDFGDGLLTRKVIQRGNVEDVIHKSGRIVINLCVNREGKVIYSKADRLKSTIKDKALLQKAEIAAKRYRYEKDYTVAPKQCGQLSFLIEIKD